MSKTGNRNNGASLTTVNPVGTETQVNLVGTEKTSLIPYQSNVNPSANDVSHSSDDAIHNDDTVTTVTTIATSNVTGANGANENGAVEQEKMTINDLQGEINDSITKLKTKLTDASGNIDFQKGDIDDICTTLSGLNLLGEFDKELYSSLNKYFDDSYNSIKVDEIDLRVRGSLSQLMYSKIINGKVGNKEWPSEAQKEIFKQSLEGPGMLSSMGSWFGSPSKNPTAPSGSPSANGKDEEGNPPGGPPGNETIQGANGNPPVTKTIEGANGNPPANSGGGGKRIIKRKRKFLKKK